MKNSLGNTTVPTNYINFLVFHNTRRKVPMWNGKVHDFSQCLTKSPSAPVLVLSEALYKRPEWTGLEMASSAIGSFLVSIQKKLQETGFEKLGMQSKHIFISMPRNHNVRTCLGKDAKDVANWIVMLYLTQKSSRDSVIGSAPCSTTA